MLLSYTVHQAFLLFALAALCSQPSGLRTFHCTVSTLNKAIHCYTLAHLVYLTQSPCLFRAEQSARIELGTALTSALLPKDLI